MSQAEAKENSLKQARKWAKAGDIFMAQSFLNQATSCGFVTNQQVLALNRMLANARDRGRDEDVREKV
jgi:aerobic-type carbon monoxide dehydrogenase small subunit (CoxS/CutS family)